MVVVRNEFFLYINNILHTHIQIWNYFAFELIFECFLSIETHQKIVPPDFSRHLRSVDIPEGTALTLECQVSGIPSPTISWFRDEENIDNSSDYVLTKINGTCCLKIRKTIKDQHSAQFTCKASNPGGETASSARVQVISKYTATLEYRN